MKITFMDTKLISISAKLMSAGLPDVKILNIFLLPPKQVRQISSILSTIFKFKFSRLNQLIYLSSPNLQSAEMDENAA